MKVVQIIILLLSLVCIANAEEYAVVTSNKNAATLALKDIRRIYFGRVGRFSSGNQAIPINQAVGSDARKVFEVRVLEKEPRKMQQYWASMVFSAKFDMPKEISSMKELISTLEENPDHVSYIHKDMLNDNLKILLSY